MNDSHFQIPTERKAFVATLAIKSVVTRAY